MAQPKIVNIYSIVPICFAHLHQTFPVFYLKKTMLRSFLLSMMDLVCLGQKKTVTATVPYVYA